MKPFYFSLNIFILSIGCGGGDGPLFSSNGSTSGSGAGGGSVGTSTHAVSVASSSGSGGSSAALSSSSAPSSSSSGGGFYWKSGVQQNVAEADMAGWTECYSGQYADNKVSMQSVLNGCPGGKLALACRQKGSDSFQLVAMGDRADVTFMFPDADNTSTHVANGVGWYMSAYSWGFVPGGDPLWKGPMDVMGISPNSPGPDGDKRLSWTGNMGSFWVGYRCGYDCGDNHPGFDYNYERVVLSAQ